MGYYELRVFFLFKAFDVLTWETVYGLCEF